MAKNSPDEGKSTKMVEKQVDPSFNNLKEYRAKRQFTGRTYLSIKRYDDSDRIFLYRS